MRPWWAFLCVLAGCRLNFDAVDRSELTVHVTSSLTITSADARVMLASDTTGPLQALPAVPGEATFTLEGFKGLAHVVVQAQDATGHWLTGTADAQLTGNSEDVDVVLDGANTLQPLGGACSVPSECITTNCIANACEPKNLTWSAMADLPGARIGGGFVRGSDDKLYFFGGSTMDNAAKTDVFIYDVGSDSWSTGPSLGTARERTTGVVVGNMIFAMGGLDTNGFSLATVEQFVPGDLFWVAGGDMSSPHGFAGAASDTTGAIYVIGGIGGAIKTVSRFANGTWTNRQQYPIELRNEGVALLPDGRIISIGGHDSVPSMYYATTYIYDQVANTWTPGPSMTNARSDLAAVTAPDGRIYALAGYASGNGRADTEVYRPGTGWIAGATMAVAHDGIAATIGPDGRIYAAGGRPGGSAAAAKCEVYGPQLTVDATTLHGAAFAPAAGVRIYVDDVPVQYATTDAAGAFSAALVNQTPGKHVVRAVDERSAYPVTATLTE